MARTVGSSGQKTMAAVRRAGLKLIHRHGYEAMSLRSLAAEVGITQGALYNHFGTKQALLLDLVKGHMEALLSALDKMLGEKAGAGADAGAVLAAFVRFHVDYHITRKREVFISYSELRSLEPANYRVIVGLRRVYEERLVAILERGAREGAFAAPDAKVAAFGILAMLSGVCAWFKPKGRLSKEAVAEIYVELVRRGLAPPAAGQEPQHEKAGP